ncbi:lipopolysaccharide-induced tumor necrosis factor-alpha factor homolog [Orbicella faveolata]|uniref:lipopolysaccharide-induced tumor necrosis factor-alpha factor homolog n=1 Tax=Orbicella faveolata TaxID=48498 RepID=UPI0009E20669|nr:lipopolysaccharide-induced tumor necrosis factor-alpha factor homolog [Orbicella faveolata]
MGEKPPPPYPDQQPPVSAYPQPGYNPTQPGYPPQQHGYQPAVAGYPTQPGYPATSTTTTIIQQPATQILAINFGEVPVAMTCPNCRANIVTATTFVTGTLTWLACLGLCVIGCDAGCCLIPFCFDPLKDVIHTCPSCVTQVGVFRRM